MWHVVDQGESLSTISDAYGVQRPSAIQNAPENEALREPGRDPEVLRPGERVWIPEEAERAVVYGGPTPTRTGQRVAFRHAGPSLVRIRPVRFDEEEERSLRWEAQGAVVTSGECAAGGIIELQVPLSSRSVTLTLRDDEGLEASYRILVGHLDPVGTTAGIRGRLAGLGFYQSGELNAQDDNEVDDYLLLSIASYRKARGLAAGTDVDDELRDRLASDYGS